VRLFGEAAGVLVEAQREAMPAQRLGRERRAAML
jgi:hypothetical protein